MKFSQEINVQVAHIIDEREKIDKLNEISFDMRDNQLQQSIEVSEQIIEMAQRLSDGSVYSKGIGYAYINIGFKKSVTGFMEDSAHFMRQAIDIFNENNDTEGSGFAMAALANYYWGKGEQTKAMELAYEGLKKIEHSDNERVLGWANYFMGTFNSDLNNNELAIEYFTKSEKYFRAIDFTIGLARTFNGLTSVYRRLKDLPQALKYGEQALELHKKINTHMGVSRSYNDLGGVYADKGEFAKAVDFFNKSLTLRKNAGNKQAIITTLTELGEVHYLNGHYNEAIDYYNEAKQAAEEINAKAKLTKIHLGLTQLYKEVKDFEKALSNHERAFKLKSEMLEADAEMRMKSIETKFNADKKEKEAEIYRLKNVELKSAYEEIEEKNKDITDSIRYAKRIQEAILPPEELVNELLPENFILYKPKDIVSGDFYWLDQKEDKILLAAVDCTGHGVPGAFMSIVGHNGLTRATNECCLTKPSEILDFLNKTVHETLRQTQNENSVRDGMDIALISIDHQTGNKTKIQYAGANNSLLIIRDGKIEEIRADKQPIGSFIGEMLIPFTNHNIAVNKGDVIYIFTDGYSDQFGGENGKKLKYSKLKELLLSLYNHPMQEQQKILNEAFETWKGSLEQVDDVCIIGVKF